MWDMLDRVWVISGRDAGYGDEKAPWLWLHHVRSGTNPTQLPWMGKTAENAWVLPI